MATTNCCPGSGQPDLSAVPLYQDVVERHDTFFRIHIHLVGLTGGDNAIGARKNAFGMTAIIDSVADPYVTIKTYGDDPGTADFLPIGEHRFKTINNCTSPVWDDKCVVLARKGTTGGVRFRLMDDNSGSDEELFAFDLDQEEFPPVTALKDGVWTDFVKQGDTDRTKSISFHFKIMITDGTDRIVTKEETEALYEGFMGREYEERVLEDGDPDDDEENALLQCWKAPESTRAVLWVLGRNDCFMHPHVAAPLFFENGYDLYVLNYKMNGACRRRGFVKDSHFNSHNKHGDFGRYNADIGAALEAIASGAYEKVLGYAHSTGGPVLLDYLMNHGDEAFDAFVFNSPFLDWGYVGGDMVEFGLENLDLVQSMAKFINPWGGMPNSTKIGVACTPEGNEPVEYLGEELVVCDWSCKNWSLHYYDWSTRPLFKVPMTVGFAIGVTGVHEKLESFAKEMKRAVTSKPFLLITSRADDVLNQGETLRRADWIGPARCEVELNNNAHDVFLSNDPSDTGMAIDMVLSWMKNKRLA